MEKVKVELEVSPVNWIVRYPRTKYRNNERIGTEKFCMPMVYDFFEDENNRKKWLDEIDIPLNCLNLSTLVLSASLDYNRPSIYNVFTVIKYLETMNIDEMKPIILDWKNTLIDGRHRVLKALVEGRPTIKAWRIKTGLDMDEQFLNYVQS